MHEPLRLTLLTPSFADTQLLRTESLYEVGTKLGHEVRILTTQAGDVLPSLAGHELTRAMQKVDEHELRRIVRHETDLLVTVKVLQVSLGLGRRVAREGGTPLLADIDDPDLEVRTVSSGESWRSSLDNMWRDRRLVPSHLKLAAIARRAPSTVSNPRLQRRWGGVVVPHARVDPGPGASHVSGSPQIAFVGTNRRHKGLPLLREAVAALSGEGWRLLVTDTPPEDARPWETWTGPLDGTVDSAALTAASDVVVIPSGRQGYGSAQLPLKLVDAMLMGRAVVVSDVGPLPWAVGDAGAVFAEGSAESLIRALRPLADPGHRAARGQAARVSALARFTVEAVAPQLQRAIENATAARHPRRRASGTGPGAAKSHRTGPASR